MGKSKGIGVQRKQGGGGVWYGLWKSLRNDWDIVRSRLFFVVGNEQRVKFWKDIWYGDELFCVSFPSLFVLAVFKDAWVKDMWSTWGRLLPWINFKREWALANRCYICQRHEESIDHILLHCVKTRSLWALFFFMFGGGMGLLLEKRGRVFGQQVLCVFFGWFGRQGRKLLLRKKSCQFKCLIILLYIFFGRSEIVYKRWSLDLS
ncbi:hypothetical protein AAG906_004790 [Vitis piasezkii]